MNERIICPIAPIAGEILSANILRKTDYIVKLSIRSSNLFTNRFIDFMPKT